MTTYSGYRHGAGLHGSKITLVGKDNSIFKFDDVQSAIDAAQIDDVIYFEPGTYTVTTAIDWSKPLTLMGMGAAQDVIIESALATRTVMINQPATGTAAGTEYKARNIKFYNTSTGDAVEIDNDGGLVQAMTLDFQNCIFYSVSGVAIDLDQTTVGQAMYVTITGNPALHWMNNCTFSLDHAGSCLNIYGMDCLEAFVFGAAAKALIFNMSHCWYQLQAQTTGGGAGQLHNILGNTYYTAANGRSAATSGGAGDFDATSTKFFNGHAVTLT